ncbi:MAG: hypothetical protein P0Y65_13925 [Candidatus Devosia phytovorans]|uniref:Uncharacterized protein n=1 Tax=Candidatus Devosia phytovorans TaxID=3121372 RepID=A0AAJ5VSE5_9HYPH|nr:hypothetical protein [Devosia sp.]WEK03286.1 MAG: hypothetical protein P0Y65_13925 [Devosia sp.]
MLPTFSRIVNRRETLNRQRIDALIGRAFPLYNKIDKHRQFEGTGSHMIRHDHTEDISEVSKASAEFVFRRTTLAKFTLQKVDETLHDLASQMAGEFVKLLVRKLDETTEGTGQVVDGGGRKFDGDLLLQSLETVEWSFDPFGNWRPPEFFGGADVEGAFREVLMDTNLRRRFEVLYARKYHDHLHREADRVLVG